MSAFLDLVAWYGLGCGLLLLVGGWILALGILRTPRARKLSDAELPPISVLVAARNEERDLLRCIASLERLDYPRDRLEIWLIDDRSTDGTPRIIAEACARDGRFRALDTRGYQTTLRAKARAIALGAQHATGRWLFILDADAAVKPGWLRGMLGRTSESTGLLTAPFFPEASSTVGILERATVLPALSFSFGAGGWGGELIPLGPNMAIRKDVYDAGGGLESVRFLVAEDIALWQLGHRAGTRVVAVAEPECVVEVTPVPSLIHLISQQRRWLVGGLGDGPVGVKWGSLVIALYALTGTASALVSCVTRPVFGLGAVLMLALAEGALVAALRSRFALRRALRLLPVSVVYTAALFVWLPVVALLSRRIAWRGEGYAVEFDRGAPGAPSMQD